MHLPSSPFPWWLVSKSSLVALHYPSLPPRHRAQTLPGGPVCVHQGLWSCHPRSVNIANCNPSATPGNGVFPPAGAPLDINMTKYYQELVGSLIYLVSCTRPDIAYAVMQLFRGFRADHQQPTWPPANKSCATSRALLIHPYDTGLGRVNYLALLTPASHPTLAPAAQSQATCSPHLELRFPGIPKCNQWWHSPHRKQNTLPWLSPLRRQSTWATSLRSSAFWSTRPSPCTRTT
ncbi:unnamed protein product [Discosporangium mesarthrocarpum]